MGFYTNDTHTLPLTLPHILYAIDFNTYQSVYIAITVKRGEKVIHQNPDNAVTPKTKLSLLGQHANTLMPAAPCPTPRVESANTATGITGALSLAGRR